MLLEIKTITLSLPYRLGSVNCYLIRTETGYILVDTGASNERTHLAEEIEGAGCKAGDLRLIFITHGDFDHTGNAAYLRKRFGTKIAMHRNDSAMIESGDMFAGRRKTPILTRMILPIASIIFGFGKSERCRPDLHIEDGHDLGEYGFDAKVMHIPGHSKGSIGILTARGDLFCGDLLVNSDKPVLNSIIDDPAAAKGNLEELKHLGINTLYPGHGKPFPMELLTK
jgi:hydroxyacylglutathione hydrolase